MPQRRSRGFTRGDWVYRANLRDEAGALIDDLGTYDPIAQTLGAGLVNANAAVLYDSYNRFSKMVQPPGVAPAGIPMAARSEGGRARILRVQGVQTFSPSTWALGSVYSLGIRFGIFEQDPSSGAFLLDPTYSMWVRTNNMLDPATWANDRQWQHERRIVVNFNDNNQTLNWRFNFAVNRTLQPHFCYGIFYETLAGSVNLTSRLFYRTLVVDEG